MIYFQSIVPMVIIVANISNNETLVCSAHNYSNYYHSECLTSVPKGYYCNSTIDRTIDKCHFNCETCNESQTEHNNNCLTCQDGLFFDLGNCTLKCNNGYFINNYNIPVCKCSDIKCRECNKESKQYNLCISCNIELGFYPMKKNASNNGSFINCYNETTISNGYFLNISTNQYEPCYFNCKKCNELGNEINNKCISCKTNYTFIKNYDNITNCYPICQYYYYFDENNNYNCTAGYYCPDNYKLINSTNKCIESCLNDNIYNYHYEFNNICYNTCPASSYALNESYLCINNLICDHYYNYDKTECISSIPEGYYCNSTELRTIDKCHQNCKTCIVGGTDEKNNCLTCKNSLYFDLGNCVTNCYYGNFTDNNTLTCKCSRDIKCNICTEESIEKSLCITCNNLLGYYPKVDDDIIYEGLVDCHYKPEGYYLKNETYYPCISNCKICTENENTNTIIQCNQCKEGYILKNDLNNNIICYKECDYYFYYDLNNNYNCTIDDKCPDNFNKLIISKKECIDDCSKDDIYFYEYKNKCYEYCPDGTVLVNNTNKCKEYKDILNCNKSYYYNYNKTECISNIPEGYYCNDTELKTIDKCHENCQTCNEGPEDNNNNCLKCKEPFYLEMGNCVINCTNSILMNETHKTCKCLSDVKCNKCSKESILVNRCLSCNSEEGYYQKFNDSNNFLFLINCYNKEIIDEGYCLDNNLNIFKPCYKTCKKCFDYGDERNNNCDECISGYILNNNTKNCWKECEYYFYFDNENKYHCTDDNNCPSNYKKLIINKKRCIDNCNMDNDYKYEYENNCYINCPDNTEPNENNICIIKQTEQLEETELICPEEYPYELVNSRKCIKECNTTDLLNNICKINNPIAKNSGTNNIKDSIKDGSLNEIIETISKSGEDLIINEKDIKYQITTTTNQNNSQSSNISTIKLGECENILKDAYNISKDEPLLIFKIDAKIEGFSSTVVEYEVYHPITKKQLNLTYCQNTSIEIQVPVIIDEEKV